MIDEYIEDYESAPLYGGGYNRITRKKVQGKNQVRNNFLASLQERLYLCTDPAVELKIVAILKKYEKAD
jgi:hypothetical protein